MSDGEKTTNGKNALLEELQSIRSILDDEHTTDSDTSGSDESKETPHMPSQIPLLQDVIETEIPDEAADEDLAPRADVPELTSFESDELFDLLIEEHVDEILTLFKSILRDNLSLLMAHFSDAHALRTAEDSASEQTGAQDRGTPDLPAEDSKRNP
jgi:hypothetical protein